MPSLTSIATFALVALTMVCTPGPNMIYLLSRSITQGRAAGFLSLAGIVTGFVVYMLSAVFGLTALLFAVPLAYRALQTAGALYLLYLAWQAVKPGARSVLEARGDLGLDPPRKLYGMGLMTSLLNPKVAILYLSLLPQFIKPQLGHVLTQGVVLGFTQIAVSVTVNSLIIVMAGTVAAWASGRPRWLKVQRWLTGGVLTGLALRMALEKRPA